MHRAVAQGAIHILRDKRVSLKNSIICYTGLFLLPKFSGISGSHLQQAIFLDPHYRDLAATEPDFAPLRHHPAFQALVNDHRD